MHRQACSSWQWFNYCASMVPGGKQLLRINMDESSVCLFQGRGRGNVFLKRYEPRTQPASLASQRTYLTLVAFVCDVPDVQKSLPQVLVANESTLSAEQFHAVRISCPENVIVLRQRTAWNTKALCVRIIRLLRDALQPFAHEYQAVLLMDAYRVHVSREIFAACASSALWAVIVPAKMTWLLQPLDTDVFSALKARVQDESQRVRMRVPELPFDVTTLITCVCNAVRHVLEGRAWAAAFDRNGYGAHQAEVGSRVRRGLEIDALPVIPSSRPSLCQIRSCLPRRSAIELGDISMPSPAPEPRPVLAIPARRLPSVRRA